jgi:hypothetical protein
MKYIPIFCAVSLYLAFKAGAADQRPAPPDNEDKACRPTKEEMQAFRPKGGLAWILDSAGGKVIPRAN